MRAISKFFTQAVMSLMYRLSPIGRSWPGRTGLVSCTYFIAAQLSLSFVIPPSTISPLWVPSAISLYACLRWGKKMGPAIWLGATMANWHAGLPLLSASLTGLGNSFEALSATLLIRYLIHQPLDFTQSGSVFRFVGITAISSTISATVGVCTLFLGNRIPFDQIFINWFTWWIGDTASMVIVTPMLLAWNTDSKKQWETPRPLEILIFTSLLLAATYVVFSDIIGHWPLPFLTIPFVIWAAFRFNLPSVTWTIGMMCGIAIWQTANGHGPFITATMNASLLLVMLYISTVGIMGLALASLHYQYHASKAGLRQERDLLEKRIHERTQALLNDIETRKHIEQQLATRERQLAEAQHLARIGSWNWDMVSNKVTWSDEHYRIFGVDKKTFHVGIAAFMALMHPEDVEKLQQVVNQTAETGTPFHTEYRIVLSSGELRTLFAHGFMERDQTGKPMRMFGTTQDITETKNAEHALKEAEEQYRTVIELCPDMILVHQEEEIAFINRAGIALFGATDASQIIGKSIFQFIHPDCQKAVRHCYAELKKGKTPPRAEEKMIGLNGAVVDVEMHASPFIYKRKPAILAIARDITERKKSAEQLVYLAHYDSLTGLPNRVLFHQRLEHALNLAERPGKSLEILFIDLDRFKYINDTLGHAAGDLVLKETAKRLQSILRESDTVARLGGDEFVVLVENVDEPHRGGTIAGKILTALEPAFMQDKEPLNMSASIGISSFPYDGMDMETLLKKADIAMYRAKESGRSAYRYYSAEMDQHTSERLMMEHALRQAIQKQQLQLYYQPKVDILSHCITGMEALLRWRHPTLGWVPPTRFIALAEEIGLINTIGKWVIHTACLQNKLWQEAGMKPLKVAVNLSPIQLADEHLIGTIREILTDTGLAPRYLELEITESAVMSNPDKALLIFNMLEEMGISLTIDDFGVGYSSLAYLKKFPIQAVKIDRSFIQGVPADRGDAAITKAIISLAHSLECSVIAEGTETRQQFEFLRAHECDNIQGFYFSKPLSADLFSKLLSSHAVNHFPPYLH